MVSGKVIYPQESYAIIGAAMEVHRTLGESFTEYVYQDAFEVELQKREIPYKREHHLKVNYKGIELKHDFYVDFVCYDKIIVECKATDNILPAHRAQTINYINIADFKLGILINFGEPRLMYERFINE